MTPVLTEPDIMEPMQIAFDGNGRMFVLELLSYMQDADATGELDPISRISLHEDTNNDGVYDKHTVFVDHLVFPRFVTPFGPNAILTMESNTDEVYRYTDTNGDGVADKKELFVTNFGRSGNVEHQQSSLFIGMDNWLYSTYNAFRVRWTPNGVLRESTGPNGAQWGITQDNYGKVYFQGGASGLPGYFQFPIHYGGYDVPDRLEPGLEIPWGSAGVGDYQGGIGMVRQPDQTLQRTTAGAGNDVFRGDRLPADLIGDYFYGEETARSVRRLRSVNTEGLNQLRNVYQLQHAEFIRSFDPLFRPVDQTTAPDGTMYITDVYRGIIQEGNWTLKGSYLRQKVDQYQIDKVIRHGRIWRLTYDGMDRDRTLPHMLDETSAQLVTHLSHPNGWWRDTAQQLLVLKQDKSVVPALQSLAQSSGNVFARFHALWTLEGLNALDAPVVRNALKDPSSDVRIQGLRLSESLFKTGNRSLESDIRTLTTDPDANVAIQALLTAKFLKFSDLPTLVASARAGNKARGVDEIGRQLLAPTEASASAAGGRGGAVFSSEQQAQMQRGSEIYGELCFSCHGTDGRGAPKEGAAPGVTMAPALSGSARVQGHRDYIIKAVLYGITGPLAGQTYSEVMVPMGANKDEWIAAVASYVRNSFGNSAGFIKAEDVAAVRTATSGRKTSWTQPELESSLPTLIPSDLSWKASASDNAATAGNGLNYIAWSTEVPQRPGMWFQVAMPAVATVSEVQFETTAGGRSSNPTGAFAARARAVSGGQAGPGRGDRGAGPAAPSASGYPRAFKVEVSINGVDWGKQPVAQGQGSDLTIATFKPVQAKFIRITQTGADATAPPWSIQRFRVFGPATTGAK